MPTFQYQSLKNDGARDSGLISAPSRADAVRMLMQRGETATSITSAADELTTNGTATSQVEQKPAAKAGFRFGRGKPTMKPSEMANLMRELATALEAGLPLMQALRTIRKQASGKGAPYILDYLISRVEAGEPLNKAAHDYGRPFDDLTIGMLRAAEASGRTHEVLHQLADLLERSVELRREVLSAAFYPFLVLILILISVIILITVLIPRLMGPLMASGNVDLPLPTKIILGISGFIQSWWIVCLLVIAGAWIGWNAWVGKPENRLRFDRFKLKIPIVGRVVRDVAVARFTHTLGTLSSAGLPVLESLRITRDTLGNRAMMQAIDEVQGQVTQGKPLAEPLERSGLFPPLLVQVVNLGERSGKLDSMLMHAATAFDRQVNVSIKIVMKALPPILIIIMACIAGFVLAAILLPLLQMQAFAQ